MKYTIQADYFRALCAVAPKKDVRYYLNGIFFGKEAVATDGAVLLITPCVCDTDPEDIILPVPAKLPSRKCESVQVEADIKTMTATVTYSDGFTYIERLIDGRYPDYNAVSCDAPQEPINEIGLNTTLLAPIQKILAPKQPIKMVFHGTGNKVSFTFPSLADSKVRGIIMPMRIKK